MSDTGISENLCGACPIRAERDALLAKNKWHKASERPTNDRTITIASASGQILHGCRTNLLEGDHWRELPKFKDEV